MKLARQLGLSAAVFAGLLLLYIGAYLGIYKNDWGRKTFGNTHTAGGTAHALHQIAAHFFAPMRYLEYKLEKLRLRRKLIGEWKSDGDTYSLYIQHDGNVFLSGFVNLEASNGPWRWTMLDYEVSEDYGDPALPIFVISVPDLSTALEVQPSDFDPNEVRVWWLGHGGQPEIVLKRTTP